MAIKDIRRNAGKDRAGTQCTEEHQWTQGWRRSRQVARPASRGKIFKPSLRGLHYLHSVSIHKYRGAMRLRREVRLEKNIQEVMLGRASQEVMPGKASGEVRPTSSGSDARWREEEQNIRRSEPESIVGRNAAFGRRPLSGQPSTVLRPPSRAVGERMTVNGKHPSLASYYPYTVPSIRKVFGSLAIQCFSCGKFMYFQGL